MAEPVRTSSPILVTGSHRSGTTWVGRMLSVSPQAHYVHEPFAPMNSRSWLGQLPRERYVHQEPRVPGPWAEDLERIAALRPRWGPILGRCRGPRDVASVVRQMAQTLRARNRGARAVIKDPFALLSAEWVQCQSDARVVVLLRHPAAFASSIDRLGWRLDVGWLLGQEGLMSGDLRDFRVELERDVELDLVGHACLVWRALTTVVNRLRRDHPDWMITRYEDLALDPVNGFADLYRSCGLEFDDDIGRRISGLNSPANEAEVAMDSKGGVARDSRSAIWTWRSRLAPEAIERVRRSTADLAADWYGDPIWWPGEKRVRPWR